MKVTRHYPNNKTGFQACNRVPWLVPKPDQGHNTAQTASQRDISSMDPPRAVLEAAHRLARASAWNSFRISQAERAACCVCLAAAAEASTQDAAVGDVSQQRAAELLAALASALARGMQLLAEQQLDVRTLKQHEGGMLVLALLWDVWLHCTRDLTRSPGPGSQRALAQLAVQITRAGTITAFTKLAKALTRLISPQKKQMAAAAAGAAAAAAGQLSAAPALIAGLLFVFSDFVDIWPGGVQALSNPAMEAAADAVAELAVAALRNKNAHWLVPAATSSSSSGTSSSGGSGNNTADAAGNLAVKLSRLPHHIASSSSSFMLLQMCCVALTAQALHRQQHGLSPAAAGGPEPAAAASASTEQQQQQQRQAVPAYHLQLQQALGLPEGLALKAARGAGEKEVLLCPAFALAAVQFDDRLSSGSSSGSGRAVQRQRRRQQQLAGAAVDAALLAPLLLVLLESCLLRPEHATVFSWMTVVAETLCSFVGLDCVPESLARDLPAAVLQLVPAIRRLDAAPPAPPAAETAAAAVVAARAAESGAIAEVAGLSLLALITCVGKSAVVYGVGGWRDDPRFQALLAAFLQQPEQFSALMEAAVRGKDKWRMGTGLFSQAGVLPMVASLSGTADTGVVLSAAAEQQVFSLLISCLKAGAATADDVRAPAALSMGPAAIIFSAADVALHAAPLLAPGDRSSSSSTSMAAADGSSSAALAAHLLGRALVSAGRGLQRLPSSGSSALGQEAHNTFITVQRSLELVASLLPQLSPALPGPVMQQLLDEQAALQQQLSALMVQQQLAALMVQPPEVVATADVGKQLEAAGAAVVAQVPVKHCCNNHGCTNHGQLTELELVGGKSCVCSGCMTARYCSRECQVAHYKHWHKAVCKRLQQERQQQPQQQQS